MFMCDISLTLCSVHVHYIVSKIDTDVHIQKTKCAAMQSNLKVVFSGLILYESLALGNLSLSE